MGTPCVVLIKAPYRPQLMHMAVFLPVPLHQLFPSGGLNYLHTYKGPSFLVALFFYPEIQMY